MLLSQFRAQSYHPNRFLNPLVPAKPVKLRVGEAALVIIRRVIGVENAIQHLGALIAASNQISHLGPWRHAPALSENVVLCYRPLVLVIIRRSAREAPSSNRLT